MEIADINKNSDNKQGNCTCNMLFLMEGMLV